MQTPRKADKYREILILLKKNYPYAKSTLKYKSNFQLLIAVMLSAQTTDISVNKVTDVLFNVAPTVEKMLALDEEKIKAIIKSIGLYNMKAKNIVALSTILHDKYRSEVPDDRSALEHLPGVGRKTANVILNVAFGKPTLAVDTHIFRLANRTKMAIGKTPLLIEKKLLAKIPKEFLQDAHHLLLWHGRNICKARQPECWHCFIRDYCGYKDRLNIATNHVVSS